MKRLVVVALLVMGQGALPDPARTPGALNPDVTQENVRSTVCQKGWTARVRPPEGLTNRLKRDAMQASGYPDRDIRHYQWDHLVPLGVGGSPTSPLNMWLEPDDRLVDGGWGYERKDDFDRLMNRLVCSGEVSLDDARAAFTDDWTASYKRYVKGAAR